MSDIAEKPQRFGEHANAFGFLRLLFASLVIVSHTPELIDGDRHRELLSRMVGTMSFGEFAVAGFFVISGFLITGSCVNSRSIPAYLLKRAARIYPAFVVASLVCLLLVAPLAGASLAGGLHAVAAAGVRMGLLARPMVSGAFAGQPYHDVTTALDGAMWTIQYEFACYLLAIVLVRMGLHRRPALLLGLAALLCLSGRQIPDRSWAWLSHALLFPAPPGAFLRLVGMFVAGAGFYGLQQRLRFDRWLLVAAALGLVTTLPIGWCADLSFALFGGYLIFATARLAAPTWVARHINNKTDISYGTYLYAWPIEQLLIRFSPSHNLLLIGLATWLFALAFGWLSWILVEGWAMRWALARTKRRPFDARTLATSS